MTIQEMQDKKRKMGITYAEIARRAGLPLPTVQKVLSGATKSPRYETILALERVLLSTPDSQETFNISASSLPEGGPGQDAAAAEGTHSVCGEPADGAA
jgi:transcriptional regulator with XRE-family HTH domain